MQQQSHSLFTEVIQIVPGVDWSATWAANRTIMLRMTSKKIKDAIDKIRPPTEVILNMSFWSDICNGTASERDSRASLVGWQADCTINEKIQLVTRQLSVLATTCLITRLELPRYKMNIKEILDQCKSLTNLNLYDNNLGTTGVISLIGVLGQCSVLNLAHNNIGTVSFGDSRDSPERAVCTEGTTRLVDVLTQCTYLNLCNNNIGTTGLESIEKCKTLTRLTYLNLCYNQINTVNIDKILSQNTGLTHLDLSQNQINTLSFDRIQIQTKYFALTDFNLSYNRIDAEGATSIARVLKQCHNLALINLNLTYNHIDAEGATSLVGALSKCSSLSKLYLGSNLIGDTGVERLTEALSQCSSLTYLTLGGNGIKKDRAKNITEVLGHRVKLMF
jgi:Ran GTPase-activating protein (RanGAP) involved in mRNA processing and transport